MSHVKEEIVSNPDSIKDEITIEDVAIKQENVSPEEFETKALVQEVQEQRQHDFSVNDGGKFPCELCGKEFDRLYYLKAHLARHRNERNYKCDQCDKTFNIKSDVKAHKKNVHVSDRLFECKVCSKRYTTARVLHSHLKTHEEEKSHKCDQCPKAFSLRYMLTNHRLTVHCEEKKFHCDRCDKTFKIQKHLDTHQNTVHATEKPFQCEVCSKKFAMSWLLKKHSLHHNASIRLRHCCDICAKAFPIPSELKEHMAAHSDERNYKCDRCDKAFKTQKQLRLHGSNVHATEKPFRCEVCSKRFPTLWALNSHGWNHDDATPHECDQCSLAFRKPYKLAKHKLVEHSNVGDFCCAVCGKKYAKLRHLQMHSRTHGDGGLLRCDQCKRRYKHEKNLVQHKKRAHGPVELGQRVELVGKVDEVKVEPVVVYDSETKQLWNLDAVVKEEIEHVDVKQEPQMMEDS